MASRRLSHAGQTDKEYRQTNSIRSWLLKQDSNWTNQWDGKLFLNNQ